MVKKSFKYYGFDKETYNDCFKMILQTNKKHLFILNSWFMAINFCYLVFSYFNLFAVTRERMFFFASYLLICMIITVSRVFFFDFIKRKNISLPFLNIVAMLSFGIFNSIAQPYMPATIFLIFMVLVAISYTFDMAKMSGILILSGIIFLISSFSKKTFSIAYYDMYNLIIVLLLSLGLHYTFQHTRLEQFTLYFRNLQIQQELEVKSSFDSLTSLLNRSRFFSVATTILQQKNDEYMALCLLDLDGFKQINDSLGHQMGDKAIQIVGKTVLDILDLNLSEKWSFAERIPKEKASFAGRLGGDEFIIFIRGKKDRSDIMALLDRILSRLNLVRMDGLDGLQASFGVTELKVTDLDIDDAYKRADEALYESKRAGKNQIHFNLG